MGTEIELKLAIGEEDAVRLLGHPLIARWAVGKPKVRRLASVYFDTPELDLAKRRIGLRVRREGRRRVQTIKAEDDSGAGVHARAEDEAQIDGDAPDLAKVTKVQFRRLLQRDGVGNRLRPVFRADIRRSARLLRGEDGCEIELAVDVGDIRNGSDRLPVREAELEVKRGSPARLYELALALAADLPLALETESKAARGYALAAGAKPQPRRASDLRLRPTMTAAETFRAIARDCLAQVLGSQACALRGEDPEGVHQMRVGLRRLRSALSIFRDHLPNDRRRAFNDDLRWLGQQLSPARDWDVFLAGRPRPRLAQHPDDVELGRMVADAEAEREAAYGALREALRSRRYVELVLRLLAWIEDEGSLADGHATATPIAEAARAILKKRHKRFRKRGKKLGEMDAAELHDLRKSAKKLRYAAEFFRSLCGDPKAAKAYIKALKKLQDGLGAMNDAATARELEGRLAARRGDGEEPRETAAAGGGGAVPEAPRPDLAKLEALWAKFSAQQPLHKAF